MNDSAGSPFPAAGPKYSARPADGRVPEFLGDVHVTFGVVLDDARSRAGRRTLALLATGHVGAGVAPEKEIDPAARAGGRTPGGRGGPR